MRKTSKTLYINADPFVPDSNSSTRSLYLLDYFDDNDRADERMLRAYLLKFGVDEGLVIEHPTGGYVGNPGQDLGAWRWMINDMSFRALVDLNHYTRLISSLQARNNDPINQILDLHTRISSLFGPKLLNSICDRTIQAMTLIPYDVPKEHTRLGWKKIHQEAPWLWVVILIQAVIRTECRKAAA